MLDLATLLTQTDRLPIQTFDWGTLQWLCNREILAGATQTVGICHLYPGRCNPLHYHPNCEEILHVQQGNGKHLLDEQWVSVQPGSVVRIPLGMKHQLVNEGAVALITSIVFSSGDRQTVFLE
jgi:oxalate decarboxylase/phosphoglucose isomerase-like protein (cupin superfamily)